jgi:hypothetical protein
MAEPAVVAAMGLERDRAELKRCSLPLRNELA